MLSKISENTIQLEQSSFSQWLNTENNPVSRIRKTGEGMTNVNKDGEQNLIQ